MVSQDLLEILRCPACVSDPQRREKEKDPGALVLVRDTWLVCQSPGCNRKYPIKDDIPIMLIDEGDKYVNVPLEELGQPE
ncbi:MAG: Trm112 family protein [Anaerolineae bacterium]